MLIYYFSILVLTLILCNLNLYLKGVFYFLQVTWLSHKNKLEKLYD